MLITMIGHSTVLIETAGAKILTDPYFGTFGHLAYARIAPPAREREELLDVDVVLLSHHHWDHVDPKFLRMLPPDVPVLAPRATTWMTRLLGARKVEGGAPWEEREFSGTRVTVVPAVHIDFTVGYVIEDGDRSVYFAGDTFHRSFMKRIGERFDLTAALIPVTTYRIPMTMGEKGAVNAVRDLRPKVVIPIHLAIEPRSPLLRTGHSPEGFRRRLAQTDSATEVVILREGESW